MSTFLFSLLRTHMNTLEHGGHASLHLNHDGVLGLGGWVYYIRHDGPNSDLRVISISLNISMSWT